MAAPSGRLPVRADADEFLGLTKRSPSCRHRRRSRTSCHRGSPAWRCSRRARATAMRCSESRREPRACGCGPRTRAGACSQDAGAQLAPPRASLAPSSRRVPIRPSSSASMPRASPSTSRSTASTSQRPTASTGGACPSSRAARGSHAQKTACSPDRSAPTRRTSRSHSRGPVEPALCAVPELSQERPRPLRAAELKGPGAFTLPPGPPRRSEGRPPSVASLTASMSKSGSVSLAL